MRAIQWIGGDVALTEVPAPTIGAGQVLLRVTAAGLCQTDIHIRRSTGQLADDGLVLGHEIAGEVVETSDDVGQVAVGDHVVVHPVWSCGECRMCIAGWRNACRSTADRLMPAPAPGITINGGMADYLAVPAAALVPAAGLDPSFAAVLTDAGLVPYHSINATKQLLGPGSSAVVIGILEAGKINGRAILVLAA